MTEIHFLTEGSAGRAADDGGLDLCHVPFLIFGEADIQLLAGDEAQHRIAEELHALIRGTTSIGPRGMRQGGTE